MMQARLVGMSVTAAVLVTSGVLAQNPTPSVEGDGQVHVALTLEGQEISLVYPPALRADDPANRALLAPTVGERLRIGTMSAHRALRMGAIAPDSEPRTDVASDGPPAPSLSRFDLWLSSRPDGWALEARRRESSDAPATDDAERAGVLVIPLAHQDTHAMVATLTAALSPTAAEAGLLSLSWEGHVWRTEFRFDDLPPTPPPPRVSGTGQARQADTDTTAFSRRTTLAERDETVLVFPDGARISTLYWKGIGVDDEDYANLASTPDGDVVRLVRAPVLRLKTDVGLRFGEDTVPTGNLAPGFAGAYGLWLRRAGDRWRFVFNDEADSWGTQYNGDHDAVEIEATHSLVERAFRPLVLLVVPRGPEGGRLVVQWGPHEWAADFEVIQ